MAAPTGHSDLFSPSSGERLINCPGSAKASRGIPDHKSIYSDEGSEAHELASDRLLKALGQESDVDISSFKFYSKDMEDYIAGYVSYCLEKVAEVKNPITMVEQQVSTNRYGEGLFGTTDFAVIGSNDGNVNKVIICDLKYGNTLVSAIENVQLKIYALCLIETFKELYDINDITLCIYQPRISNISEFSLNKDDLYKWGDTVLKDTIQKIKEGSEEFHTGRHCKFCKAKPICRALKENNMKIAKDEFAPPYLLKDEEIEAVLDQADEITDWLNSIKEFALSEALAGKSWNNYKVVEGRSNRKIKDENLVAGEVIKAGFDPYEKKLATLTELKKRLGNKLFSELVDPYTFKPEGKPTLVSRDDKRPEMNLATNDFKDMEEEN